jgi:hypothetical protein
VRIPHRFVSALVGAMALLSAAPARADIRVWSELPEGAEEGVDPLRFFDVTAFVQPGYIYRLDDPDGFNPEQSDNFWLQRARFGFRAQLYPWLRVRLEAETTPNFALQDAFVELLVHPLLTVRLGQFQIPFLRTYQYNEANLAFVDRLVYTPLGTDRQFLRYLSPRDIGVMVTGRYGEADSPTLEYWLGAFLGRGANQTRDADSALLWALRLQLHVLGVPERVEWESDIVRNEVPRVAVGASAYTNCDDRGQFNLGTTVDAEVRYEGLYAAATFVRFNNGPVANDDQLPAALQDMGVLDAHDNFFSAFGRGLGYGTRDGCAAQLADEADPTMGLTLPYHVAWGVSAQVQYVLPRLLFPVDGMELELLFRFDLAQPNNPDDATFLGSTVTDPMSPDIHPEYRRPTNFYDGDNGPSQWRLTFGLNWFPTAEQHLRLSLNYQLRREVEPITVAGADVVGIKNDIFWAQLTLGI